MRGAEEENKEEVEEEGEGREETGLMTSRAVTCLPGMSLVPVLHHHLHLLLLHLIQLLFISPFL